MQLVAIDLWASATNGAEFHQAVLALTYCPIHQKLVEKGQLATLHWANESATTFPQGVNIEDPKAMWRSLAHFLEI